MDETAVHFYYALNRSDPREAVIVNQFGAALFGVMIAGQPTDWRDLTVGLPRPHRYYTVAARDPSTIYIGQLGGGTLAISDYYNAPRATYFSVVGGTGGVAAVTLFDSIGNALPLAPLRVYVDEILSAPGTGTGLQDFEGRKHWETSTKWTDSNGALTLGPYHLGTTGSYMIRVCFDGYGEYGTAETIQVVSF